MYVDLVQRAQFKFRNPLPSVFNQIVMYTSFCLNLVHRSGRSARHLLFDIRRLVGTPKERKNRLLGLYRTSGGVIPDTIPHGQGLILLFKVDASDVAERPLNERENQTGCFFAENLFTRTSIRGRAGSPSISG